MQDCRVVEISLPTRVWQEGIVTSNFSTLLVYILFANVYRSTAVDENI